MRNPVRMSIDPAQRRLGTYVARRRLDIGLLSQQALADAADVSLGTITNLESGKRPPSTKTKHFVEKALGWTPGSCDEIVMGGEPTIVDGDSPPPNPALEALTAALELADDEDLDDLLTHLREAVAKRRRGTQNVNPGRRSNTAG